MQWSSFSSSSTEIHLPASTIPLESPTGANGETSMERNEESVKNLTDSSTIKPNADVLDIEISKPTDNTTDQFLETKEDETPETLLPNEVGDETLAESLLTAIQFPAVADLNSRIRKLVSFFLRVKNQREMECFTKVVI